MITEGRLDSLAGCVAYVIGADEREIPKASEVGLKQWLAGRNLGLITSEPYDRFTWPGHFLARLRDGDGAWAWAVLFGAPPGVVYVPGGAPFAFDSLTATFDSMAFLVPYELEVPNGSETPLSGTVHSLAVAEAAEASMREVQHAEAVAGRGLKGDRYERKAGTFTDERGRGNDLTLVEAEALDGLNDGGVVLSYPEARRNVVTSGISLDALIGRRFRIGEVECLGQRRCEPCAHLERLTRPGVLRGLVHRGGLRADVLTDGVMTVGDRIEVL